MSGKSSFFSIEDSEEIKGKLLSFIHGQEVFAWLDSQGYQDEYGKFDLLVAAGVQTKLETSAPGAFASLKGFRDQHPGWLFGFLSYELKNDIENLVSENPDGLQFPELFFFEPLYVFGLKGNTWEIWSFDPLQAPADLYNLITALTPDTFEKTGEVKDIRPRISKEDYSDAVQMIREHIIKGDIYEMNYCQEFYAENTSIDPFAAWISLSTLSPAPSSAFIRMHSHYILSASPERFLCKRGDTLISQPIKGTRPRHTDPVTDKQLAEELYKDEKERAENVMIVDLVRNDLARSAETGTVEVKELFGIYSFRQVHQMISTISCKLKKEIHPVDAIKHAFPMGSMTGAPKVMAMKLIETYERTRRGIYSGAIGYFSPDDDFDFNVVIRTLLYNADNGYLSFQAGGAITYDSNPDNEYEECLLKAKAIHQLLQGE